MREFSNKIVIVTGAAGAGIGHAVAEGFAKEGANVLVSDAHPTRPIKVAQELNDKYHVKCLGLQCDVRDRTQVDNMAKAALDEWGRVDILVNNAGIDRPEPIWEMSDETWDLVINVNLKGTFYCTRAVLPTMIKQRYGKIVNLSSVAAWIAKGEGGAYVAAKAAIEGFTRATAAQVGEYGINVNAVAPGLAWNPFLAKVRPPEYFEQIKKERLFDRAGTPEDIANGIMFLASEKASYITGCVLCISGGWLMH